MKAKLLALLIGMLLIGTAFYFGAPEKKHSADEETENEQLTPVHSPIPHQKPGLFQTVSFHPSGEMLEPAPDARPALNNVAAEVHWNNIASLVNCATSEKPCAEAFPETDPSSKFFAIRDRILDEADWFLAHQSSGPAQAARVAEAAHFLISVPDEEVQGRALDLLLQNNIKDAKIPALIEKNMAEVVDTDNVQKISQVFKLSLDDSNVETITNFTCNTILHGATYASKEMAKMVPEILNESTRSRLEACMAKLPNSQRLDSMRSSLYPANAI
ncbi:MAG: hypothetical protein ACXWQO_02310 [Bdellovibrionota bacterium]